MDDLYKKKEAHILKYIDEKYAPLSIFLYGSFKDGLADSASDFDCFIVSVDEIASKDLDYFLPFMTLSLLRIMVWVKI